MSYLPGQTASSRFRLWNTETNQAAAFLVPPAWYLRTSDGEILDSGSTIADAIPGYWNAAFVIPQAPYISSSALTIEITGADISGVKYSSSQEVSVHVKDDRVDPVGILYIKDVPALVDLRFSAPPISISWKVSDILEQDVSPMTTIANPAAVVLASGEVSYTLDLGVLTLTQGSKYPYLLTAVGNLGNEQAVIQKPLFSVNSRISQMLINLNQYLDKARLVEIDPTLQYTSQELVHFIYQGLNYINSAKPEISFWNLENFNASGEHALQMASAFMALNARYLAEGMNDFEFNGLSTTLSVNRKDALQYKIDEINAWLNDTLPDLKKSIIAKYGPGTPPPVPGADLGNAMGRTAQVAISVGTMTNWNVNPGTFYSRRRGYF